MYNKVVAVGDINGDGLGDLPARTRTGDLYLYLYKGAGGLTEPFTVEEKVGSGFGDYDQLTAIWAGGDTPSGDGIRPARASTNTGRKAEWKAPPVNRPAGAGTRAGGDGMEPSPSVLPPAQLFACDNPYPNGEDRPATW